MHLKSSHWQLNEGSVRSFSSGLYTVVRVRRLLAQGFVVDKPAFLCTLIRTPVQAVSGSVAGKALKTSSSSVEALEVSMDE